MIYKMASITPLETSIIWSTTKSYVKNGLTITDSGTREWRKNGRLHRDDGPAIIWADGTCVWYRHGRQHRTDGPAMIWPDGQKEWWLDNEKYTFDQWLFKNTTFDHQKRTLYRLKYGQ